MESIAILRRHRAGPSWPGAGPFGAEVDVNCFVRGGSVDQSDKTTVAAATVTFISDCGLLANIAKLQNS